MEFHEYANIFPMMNETEFKELCDDIVKYGYRLENPIITYQGKILDGRNRFNAAEKTGTLPMFVEFHGDDPLALVLSQNLHRRHLNETQRGLIASKLANTEKHLHKTDMQICISQPEAAQMLSVSPRTVATIKAVERDAPEFVPLMERGEMTAHEAQKKTNEKRRNQERTKLAENAKDIPASDMWNITTGDFREIMESMPDNSIDMIFTDPPYDENSILMYGELAEIASRKLKVGGSLLTYVGHYAILRAGNLMEKHLRFWWTIAIKHSGNSARLPGKWVFVEWKPLLWFVKEKRNSNEFVSDLFTSSQPDKLEHEWQQDTSEAAYYIEHLTNPGDLVADPFAGSGTTLIAACKLGRRSIGIELDQERANVARQRIDNITRQPKS